jgi:hypothetical protein
MCAVCETPVAEAVGQCGRCRNLLSLPGAVRTLDPSAEPARPGGAPPAPGDFLGDRPEDPAKRTAGDGPTCGTAGCGQPALPSQSFCQDCLLDPARRVPRARIFRLLTPWSEVIQIPDGTTLAIGRDPSFSPCADRLQDHAYVSRRHLFLRAEQGRLVVRDLGSHNGTARNGHPLEPDVEVDLVTNDALTLGEQVTFFVVR